MADNKNITEEDIEDDFVILNIELKLKEGETQENLLYRIIDSENVEQIQLFLKSTFNEQKVDINHVYGDKKTALHIAVEKGKKDIVAELLKQGANTRAQDNRENTALHIAAEKGDPKIIEMLLKEGLKLGQDEGSENRPINAKNINGQTALHIAAWRTKDQKIIEMLIKEGADVNALDTRNQTPLYQAASAGNTSMVELLIAKGAKIDGVKTDQDELNITMHDAEPSYLAIIGDNKIYQDTGKTVLSAIKDAKQTPLHVAIINGYPEVAKKLIDMGADINAQDKDGQTPLHIAIEERKLDIVQMLLGKRPNLSLQNNDNNTPLHIAVLNELVELAKKLIGMEADIDARGKDRKVPLMMAWEKSKEMTEMLLNKGADVRLMLDKEESKAPENLTRNPDQKKPHHTDMLSKNRELSGHFNR